MVGGAAARQGHMGEERALLQTGQDGLQGDLARFQGHVDLVQEHQLDGGIGQVDTGLLPGTVHHLPVPILGSPGEAFLSRAATATAPRTPPALWLLPVSRPL